MATHPKITTLGVLVLNIDVTSIETDIEIDELRVAFKELKTNNYISYKIVPSGPLFLILGHYNTLPKGDQTVKKSVEELKGYDPDIRNFIEFYLDITTRSSTFVPPTVKEVLDFSLSNGYYIDAKEFIDYYDRQAQRLGKTTWVDGNGKQVKDWRMKLQRVWFKNAQPIKLPKDAPKGLETFHIFDNGQVILPDYWDNGLPYSNDGLIKSKKLQEAYARKRNS